MNSIDHPHVSRELEWVCTLTLAAFGIALALPGRTFDNAFFAPFAAVAPETTWATFALAVAGFRALALVVNGRWHRSPTLRMSTALVGAAVWLELATLYWRAPAEGTPPMAVITSLFLALDVLSVLRSAADQASNEADLRPGM